MPGFMAAVLTRRLVVTALVAVAALAAVTWRSTVHGRGPAAAAATSLSPASPMAAGIVSQTRWCATPRHDEPLLKDAADVLGRRGTLGDAAWFHGVVGAEATVRVVADEQVCVEAARAYGADRSTAVLVIRVGDIYLVDDQRPREGADAFWHVRVLDTAFKPTIFAYGGGA